MKRTLMIFTVALNCSMIFSQTIFDALKSTENDINGTARYSGMAGAFGALGGDPSAVKDNPAGIGVYRKSEFTATIDALMQGSASNWNDNVATDSKYGLGLNNISLVLASPTWRSESGYSGLLSSNFSFAYNKLKNFNRNAYIKSTPVNSSMTDYFAYFSGTIPNNELEWDNYPQNNYTNPFNNYDLPWMSVMAHYGRLINPVYNTSNEFVGYGSFLGAGEKTTPSYILTERGSINEYSLGWSGNFSNKFFFGATFNIQSINYRADSKYDEAFGNGGGMTLDNTVTTKGNGINANLGIIAVPVDFLRIGFSLHTPMFYSITTNNYSTLSFNSSVDGNVESPENYVDYQLQTPLQLNASAAFIFGKKGLISAEYVFSNNKGMKLLDDTGNAQVYQDDNEDMGNMLNNSRTIKIGGEYKVTDSFSTRLGFANTSAITNSSAVKLMIPNTTRTDPEYFQHIRTNYITAGLGYREANWYIDFAYMHKVLQEKYYAFNSTSTEFNQAYATKSALVLTNNNNLIITLGLKF